MTTRRPIPRAGQSPSEHVKFPRRDLLLATPLAGLGGVMTCILVDAADAWMAFWVVGSGLAIAAYLVIERYRPRA